MTSDKQHEKFMRIAIRLADQNVLTGKGGPFGAVIVKDGKVVAKSANTVTTTTDPTAHAEIATIRLACKKLKTYNLSGCVIYTSCEPCPMCLGAIYWAHLDKIYWACTKKDAAENGFSDQFIYDEIARPVTKRMLPVQQLLREEAQQSFKLWQESDFKIDY